MALLGRLFVEYGAPARLLSDRGSNFLSDVATKFLRSESGSRVLASPHHPQTGGKNENSYKLILAQVRSFATDNQRDWDQLLQQFDAAYNNAPIEGPPSLPNSIFSGWVSVDITGRMVSPVDVAPPISLSRGTLLVRPRPRG